MAEFVDEVQQLERKSDRLNNWVALFIGLAVLSFVTGLALTCQYQQLAYFVIGCLFVATFIFICRYTYLRLEDTWHDIANAKYSAYIARRWTR